MKLLFIFFSINLIILWQKCESQTPTILWERTYGGSEDEEGSSINLDSLGNIYVFGYSKSIDNDVSNPMGGSDFWLLKTDEFGSILSNKNFGDFRTDAGKGSCQTSDGGFILCGETSSYNLPGFHGGNFGTLDVYVVKVDSLLNLQWHQCYGSLGDESGIEIKNSGDGGFVFLADVSLNSFGSVPGFYGMHDWWVNKIDSNGNVVWSKCIGGTGLDVPTSLIVLPDRSIVVTGANGSSDGDVTCDPDKTCRVVKLDSNGNFVWDRCYGGSSSEMGYDIVEGINGGFYVAALTSSNDGDVLGHIGGNDIWLFQADSLGNITWSRCFGGSNTDSPVSISKTSDGGLLVCGKSTSHPSPSLPFDAIIIKTDSVGNLEWQTFLGGSDWDEGLYAKETSDHNFVVTGFTKSNDGDISFNHGNKDIWVVKLEAPVSIEDIPDFRSLSYIIKKSSISLFFDSKTSNELYMNLFDLVGHQLLNSKYTSLVGENNLVIPVNILPGVYIVKIRSKKENISFKFIRE